MHQVINGIRIVPGHVRVSALPEGYRRAVLKAIEEGQFFEVNVCGEYWVLRSELEDLAGPGTDTDDPDGGCYIPPEACF